MTSHPQDRSGRWRTAVLLAVCVAAAAAVSLFSPITWTDYFRLLVREFGWPLVAAFLTAAVILVVALYAARRRRASEIVAFSLFISMILHMAVASYFGFVVVRSQAAEIAREKKTREISTGLQSLVESILSQEVRAKFAAADVPDTRRIEPEKKATAEPAEKKTPAPPKPELKTEKQAEPQADKIKAELASKPRTKVEEVLAKAPDKLPDISQAKVVAPKPVKTEKETQPVAKPAPKPIAIAPVKTASPDAPDAVKTPSMEAKLKDAQRDPLRERMAVAAVQPAGQKKIEETLQKATLTDKAAALKLSPGTVAATARTEEPQARATLAAKGSLEGTHRAAPGVPDAPTVKMISHELGAAPVKGAAVSLAEPGLARTEKLPTLKESAALGTKAGQSSLAEPVRIKDKLALAGKGDSPEEAPLGRGGLSARTDLGVARSQAAVSAGGGEPGAKPRAQVNLQGGPVAAKTFVSGQGGGGLAPAPTGKAKVQEGLRAASGREAASHRLVDVGGSAEAVPVSGGSASVTPKPGLTGDYPSGLAPTKADTRVDGGPAGSAPSGGDRVKTDLSSGVASSGRGTGVRVDVGAPQSLAKSGGPAVVGDGLAGGSIGGSAILSPVHVGGNAQAVSAPAGAAGTGGDIGFGGGIGGGGPREGRQELAAGKIGGRVEGGSAEGSGGQLLAQKGSLTGTGAEASHASYMDKSAGSRTGIGTRTATDVRDAPQIGGGSGGGRGGAATLSAKIIPGVAQAETGGGGSSEGSGSGGSTVPPELARLKLNVGKSEGGAGSWGGGGDGEVKMARASLPTSGRGTGSGQATSLVDSDVSSVAPGTGGRGSGGGRDKDFSLAKASGGTSAGGGTYSIGLSAREAAGNPGTAGGGEGSSGPSGPSSRSEVRVTKAGGQWASDGVPGGAGSGRGGGLGPDAASLSSASGDGTGRAEKSLADSGSAMAGPSARMKIGPVAAEAPRTVISSALSDVPKSVPEKAIYKLRTPERRKEAIKEMGGSDKTEQAVERGLYWLSKAQSDDGRWDVDGFKNLGKNGGAGDRSEDDVALTGLCLLSYLGAGYTHVKGDYKETVRKALNWLVVGQKENGDLQREGQMYGQAMAAAALCESYSLTGDERLLEPAKKAIGFILKAQNPGAGWRYEPRKDNDTSVTGWQVLALKSAMIAGIEIPPKHFQWVETWLNQVRLGKDGGLYSYMSGHGATPTMTAEGWFCQLLMGEQTRTRGQAETIPYLMANTPAWSPKDRSINLYYWYYATLALHMSGSAEFEKWNQALTKALLAGQVKSGPAEGSWDPVCILGERGGRVYTTATAALCLEVYYRYLPFYKQK